MPYKPAVMHLAQTTTLRQPVTVLDCAYPFRQGKTCTAMLLVKLLIVVHA
jgi:hypothetical protein